MSNQFPQHPLPFGNLLTLSAGGAIFEALAAGAVAVDTLVIPPPPAATGNEPDPVRIIDPQAITGALRIVNKGADTLTAILLLKTGGEEYIIDSSVGLGVGGLDFLGPAGGGIPLLPGDDGIYLRLSRANVADTTADVSVVWHEVRNLTVVDVELPQDEEITLLENDSESETLLVASLQTLAILNPDGTAQPYGVSLNDGTDEVLLTPPAAVAALTAVTLIGGGANLLPGYSLKATVGASAAVKTAIARVPYTRTNVGPARPNQGGAY